MHTVIVGGGIAGLWIALQLRQRGDRVTVLEKQEYLGGRILTSKKHHVEIGAGRIHVSHARTGALIDQYSLPRIPISDKTAWISKRSGGTPEPNYFEQTWSALCTQLQHLSPHILASHTLRDLTRSILGVSAGDALLERFPYRAEIDVARADVALKAFLGGSMGTRAGYYVVGGGLSTLIDRLAVSCRQAGVVIRTGMEVQRLDEGNVIVKRGPAVGADRVILAVPVNALRHLLPVKHLWAPLTMEPLTRIYATYPTPAWFSDVPRFVTDSPLRYVIPINPASGTVMISYTDSADTRAWHNRRSLQTAIQRELRALFPDRDIPEPTWIQAYEWSDGCTYWKPGEYDPSEVANRMMCPAPNVYVCGESLSVGHQAWIEGALETAELLLRHLSD
jgi:glycine/D-amino acid oxidase-like deaminating enzyme